MNLDKLRSPTVDEIFSTKYDLVICASGYESRSFAFAERLSLADCPAGRSERKIAFGFEENADNEQRHENDRRYKELGYEIVQISSGSSEASWDKYNGLLANGSSANNRILVDISSMARSWYGSLISYIAATDDRSSYTIDFIYIPSRFSEPDTQGIPNAHAGPVQGFSSFGLPMLPTALIMGIGFDSYRSVGLKEDLDPNTAISFQAGPGSQPEFDYNVELINEELLHNIPNKYRFKYPILDPVATFNILDSVAVGLSHTHQVVLASFGPKIFSLCCFLVAIRRPGMSVWRVSAGHNATPKNHVASEIIIPTRTEWVI